MFDDDRDKEIDKRFAKIAEEERAESEKGTHIGFARIKVELKKIIEKNDIASLSEDVILLLQKCNKSDVTVQDYIFTELKKAKVIKNKAAWILLLKEAYIKEKKTHKKKVPVTLEDGSILYERVLPDIASFNCSINGEQNVIYELNQNGVWRITDKDTEDEYQSPIFRFNQGFVITAINRHKSSIQTYSGIFNKTQFVDLSLGEIKSQVYDSSCVIPSKSSMLGVLIDKYAIEAALPICDCKDHCGFTREGWINPNINLISSKLGGKQAKIIDSIKRVFALEINIEEIKSKVQNLYKATSINHKDIFYALMCILPFTYALKPYIDLQMLTEIGGMKGTTGKTAIGKLITSFVWNNLGEDQEVLTSANVMSSSRLFEIMSCATFPIVLDEFDKASDEIESTIKALATSEVNDEKKAKDQSLKVDKPICAPIILTFNETPQILSDSRVRERSLFINEDTEMTDEQKKIFQKAKHDLKAGEIGKYIYLMTKDMAFSDLTELYEKQSELEIDGTLFHISPRQAAIYKLLEIGVYFAKQWFGLDLSLIGINMLLRLTQQLSTEIIFDAVKVLVKEGRSFGKRHIDNFKWINQPVLEHKYKGIYGYVLDTGNALDIANYLHKPKITLASLFVTLQIEWPNIFCKFLNIEGIRKNFIFIPAAYFIKEEEDAKREAVEEAKFDEDSKTKKLPI